MAIFYQRRGRIGTNHYQLKLGAIFQLDVVSTEPGRLHELRLANPDQAAVGIPQPAEGGTPDGCCLAWK